MSSAGCTARSRRHAKRLLLLGIIIAVVSIVLNAYLPLLFNTRYRIDRRFELEENVSRSFALSVGETNIALVTYNVSTSATRPLDISVELIRPGGRVLHYRAGIIQGAGNLFGQVTLDDSLDQLQITIKNEGWSKANCEVQLTYTKSPSAYFLFVALAVILGIAGVVITFLGLFQYFVLPRDELEDNVSLDVTR